VAQSPNGKDFIFATVECFPPTSVAGVGVGDIKNVKTVEL
jgi:hypothetical protein